jgi:dTDP-glucose 4,6-dehydratase
MKTIIITGGSGFIGTALVKYFIKLNLKVINIDKLTYASKKNSRYNNIKEKNYLFFKKNITDRNFLNKIFKKYRPDYIINCAAETHVDNSIANSKNFISSNILGTYCLLEEARLYYKSINKKFRFLQISTDEVYGDVKGKKKSIENDVLIPSSPYSSSKAAADSLVLSWCRTYNLPVLITRSANNYGPLQHSEKLIPVIIKNLMNNKKIPMYGNGNQMREWIYVDDNASGIAKVLFKGKVGQIYNIGSNDVVKNISLIKIIIKIFIKLKIIKKSKTQFIKKVNDRPGHDIKYSMNTKKINNQLKWSPKFTLLVGLLNTINWYLKNKKFLDE